MKLKRGVEAIEEEFELNGTEEDKANLDYCLNGTANKPACLPKHVKAQIAQGHYHGGSICGEDFDQGHDGMTLDDFVQHPNSQQARLEKHHVLALRLYTTSSYPCFNKPLREGVRPHPFGITVKHLAEGLRKLRAVPANDGSSFTQVRAVCSRDCGGWGVEITVSEGWGAEA
eukprot:2494768-Rhodomonas_salina.1